MGSQPASVEHTHVVHLVMARFEVEKVDAEMVILIYESTALANPLTAL